MYSIYQCNIYQRFQRLLDEDKYGICSKSLTFTFVLRKVKLFWVIQNHQGYLKWDSSISGYQAWVWVQSKLPKIQQIAIKYEKFLTMVRFLPDLPVVKCLKSGKKWQFSHLRYVVCNQCQYLCVDKGTNRLPRTNEVMPLDQGSCQTVPR